MWKTESKGWIMNGVADVAREIDEKAFRYYGAHIQEAPLERISVMGLGLGLV